PDAGSSGGQFHPVHVADGAVVAVHDLLAVAVRVGLLEVAIGADHAAEVVGDAGQVGLVAVVRRHLGLLFAQFGDGGFHRRQLGVGLGLVVLHHRIGEQVGLLHGVQQAGFRGVAALAHDFQLGRVAGALILAQGDVQFFDPGDAALIGLRLGVVGRLGLGQGVVAIGAGLEIGVECLPLGQQGLQLRDQLVGRFIGLL